MIYEQFELSISACHSQLTVEKLESLANPSNDIEMESYTQLVLRAATAAPISFLFIDNTAAATLLLWQKKKTTAEKTEINKQVYTENCALCAIFGCPKAFFGL